MNIKCPAENCNTEMKPEQTDVANLRYWCEKCQRWWFQVEGETRLRTHDEFKRMSIVFNKTHDIQK